MMHGNAKIINSDAVHLEITISAPVSEWKALIKDMPLAWPKSEFIRTVRAAIEKTVERIGSIHSVE